MIKRPTTLLIAAAVIAATLAGCAAADGTAATTGAAGEVETTTATSTTDEASNAGEPESESSATAATTGENEANHASASDYEWENGDVVEISLGETSSANSSEVAVDGTTITITAAGTYQLTGALSDGEVVVNAGDDDLVQLILNGVSITNSDGAAIAVMNAGTAVVIVADGSQNTLADGSSYVLAEGEDEPNAALYSKADLTITGEGTLAITGNYNDGVGAKDGLVIESGNLVVTAIDDGIRGKDYVVVNGGTIEVTSGGDAVKADNTEDATRGYVSVTGGSITIEAGADGISAETDVLITDGEITITTAGGASGNIGETSAKGIKGLVSVIIDGGTFTLDNADDSVHSNDTIVINGGDFTIATGDDGIHADANLEVNDTAILITESYEGLESAVITINSGDIEIHSDDDGINVAGGQDGSGFEGGPGRGGGRDGFAVNSDYQLLINGGTILMYAQGDGLDSNGIAVMTGGTAIVHGPTANNNGAIDAGSFDISGGLLIAVGSAGMAQGVDSTSTQASLEATLTNTQSAGTVIHVETNEGDPVLTFEPAKDYASIVFSSPDLDSGTSYDVYLGGSADGDETGGLYANSATYTAGTLAGSLAAR